MKFRSKAQIARDYPEVVEWSKHVREIYGYAGLKLFANNELVYSWEKSPPEKFKVPTNTILNRDGTYKKPPVGTFWNAEAKATIKGWKK